MDFDPSPKVQDLSKRLNDFMEEHIYPNQDLYARQLQEMGYGVESWENWGAVPIIEELKPKAREAGLWNLFLPESRRGGGLTNRVSAAQAEAKMGCDNCASRSRVSRATPTGAVSSALARCPPLRTHATSAVLATSGALSPRSR